MARSSAQRRPALPGRQPFPSVARRDPRTSALNEGRPFRAGNPCHTSAPLPDPTRTAQRRPALPGRQPSRTAPSPLGDCGRSTKAGPSGPATLVSRSPTCGSSQRAQRRPALPGRQPPGGECEVDVAVDRSTKAGPSGPATREVEEVLTGIPLRSTKAGPSGPATPPAAHQSCRESCSLNEGRPFRAGNPGPLRELAAAALLRSTKAGPSGPATPETRSTPGRTSAPPLNEGRPFRAGNPGCPSAAMRLHTQLAQRRPALPGRQPHPQYLITTNTDNPAQRRPALPGRQPPRMGPIVLLWLSPAQRRPALPGRQPSCSGA